MFGRARLVGRRFDAERGEVGVHRRGHLGRQLADRNAALERAPDDLVVDVGDVADVGDVVPERASQRCTMSNAIRNRA
jgi:hypothetical protein